MRLVRLQHLLALPLLILGKPTRLLGQVLLQAEGLLALFAHNVLGRAVRQKLHACTLSLKHASRMDLSRRASLPLITGTMSSTLLSRLRVIQSALAMKS